MFTINNMIARQNKVLGEFYVIYKQHRVISPIKLLLPFLFDPEFVSEPWILFRTFETCM